MFELVLYIFVLCIALMLGGLVWYIRCIYVLLLELAGELGGDGRLIERVYVKRDLNAATRGSRLKRPTAAELRARQPNAREMGKEWEKLGIS